MVKRMVLVLLALTAVAGLLGAQESKQSAQGGKIAISVDLFPLVKGILWSDSDVKDSLFGISPGFEYLAAPHFTVGGVVDLWPGQVGDIDFLYFGLAAHGRYYPLSEGLDKFFIDAGLGFNVFSLDGETDKDKGGMAALTMSLKVGWKVVFGGKFFLEPSMAFVYAKTPGVGVPTPTGWQPGLNIGMAF